MPKTRALVLGGGFQGICAALALEREGFAVTLIDKASDCFLRASLRNEGKVHLGHVYANDPTFQTPSLMLRSALCFAPLIEKWLGCGLDWHSLTSHPFTYLVLRDSLLGADAILGHYEALQAEYENLLFDSRLHYLGRTPDHLWLPVLPGNGAFCVNPERVVAAFQTPELAVKLTCFREILKQHLAASDAIDQRYGRTVRTIARTPWGFRVQGITAENRPWVAEAEIVVNCLWEQRLYLDAQLGLTPSRKWVHRLKYRVMATLPLQFRNSPSFTLVLGRFGDLVVYPDGNAYISWYPTCMRGWSDTLLPPPGWEQACGGRVDSAAAAVIAGESLAELDVVLPGLKDSRVTTVDAGIICCWGESDIDDPGSQLHKRYEVGISENDGYFSIDTGKFTCAPYFANQLAERLSGEWSPQSACTLPSSR